MNVIQSKEESALRWFILFLTCVLMIGNYYCYDIPAALNSQLEESLGEPSNYPTLFSLLYSVYSLPNIILPFFGGYFVDRFGINICLTVFSVCISIGQLILTIGVSFKSWPLMYLGRAIFGLGGENLGVASSAMLAIWFKDKELALAFGLNLSISRLGSVLNNVLSPRLMSLSGINSAFWFGFFLSLMSTFSVVFIYATDKHVNRQISENTARRLSVLELVDSLNDSTHVETVQSTLHTTLLSEPVKSDTSSRVLEANGSINMELEPFDTLNQVKVRVKFRDIKNFKLVFWILVLICTVVYGKFVLIYLLLTRCKNSLTRVVLTTAGCILPFNNIASTLLLERDFFKSPPRTCHLLSPDNCQNSTNVPNQFCPTSMDYQPPMPIDISLTDIDCNDNFWSKGCAEEFCRRQRIAQWKSATVMSIPYTISAVLSPFLGGLVDIFGLRAVIIMLSPLALAVVHTFLGYSSVNPIGPLVGQGLAYSCFAAVLWPSIALVADEHLIGLGYGLTMSVQNIGLALFPLGIAAIYAQNHHRYLPGVEVFFMTCAIVGVFIGIFLNIYDFHYLESKLNKGRFNPMKFFHLAVRTEESESEFALFNPNINSPR